MIRYVCLSDLHLGDRDSILTRFEVVGERERPLPSPVFEQLVVCLRALVGAQEKPPTLIINGDLLELAFGSVGNALSSFTRCAALMLKPDAELFDEVLYLPGNHDHHMWEVAREEQYCTDLRACSAADELPPMAHSTRPFPDSGVVPRLVDDVLARVQADGGSGRAGVRIVYPNLVLHDAERGRGVLIHHGHFVESVYRIMSAGRRWLFPHQPPARSVDDYEAENFAWIEFVWSLLGRSGEAGADVETLFEMLRYPLRVRSFSAELAARVAPAVRMPFLPMAALRRLVLRIVFRRLARGLSGERTRMAEVCSPEAMQGVRQYLFGPSFRQLQAELGAVPEDLSFIFGHTHKPFDKLLGRPGGGTVRVVNSGGWTVDTATESAMFGASLLFIGHDLELVPLRVYNDAPGGGEQALTLEGSGPAGPGKLARWLSRHLESEQARRAWGGLVERIDEARRQRREVHRARYGASQQEAR